MGSWFRAAEELFEVVDRKAKQVVNERLVDETSGVQNSDTNPLVRVLSTTSIPKVGLGRKFSASNPVSQKNLARAEVAKKESWQNGSPALDLKHPHDKEHLKDPRDKEHGGALANSEIVDTDGHANTFAERTKQVQKLDIQTSNADANSKFLDSQAEGSLEIPDNIDDVQKSGKDNDGGICTGISYLDANEYTVERNLGKQNLDEPVKCKFAAENGSVTVELVTEKISIEEITAAEEDERSQEKIEQSPEKIVNGSITITSNIGQDGKRQLDASKVEDQLDEARGLLKVAVSSGQSKEARLARICAGLSSRLQEYKAENSQLEELVHEEREAKMELERKLEQLQSEVLSTRAAGNAAEAEMAAALSSKNTEIEALLNTMEVIKRQAAISEGKLATLQANIESMTRSRDMAEAGMIQTLREELIASEHRTEEERKAHSATRKAAAERETELEQQIAESTAALTKMQKTLHERTQRAAELEHTVSMLEMDCTNLTQELQEMEVRLRREQKKQPEETAQSLQAWKEDAERARQAQREAEVKLSTVEAETQKLRVELASLKRDTNQHSAEAHIELENRFRELTDLLYQKQTQLEAMASEKAAAILQVEKESRRFREAQAEAEKHKSMRQSHIGWDEENDLKPLEYFGLQQRRLVGPSIQKAVKFLDSGAMTAGRFLWRRPMARLIALFYLVFIHVFLMYLLHRLQEQTDDALLLKEEIEAAAAVGLVKRGML